MKSLKNKIYSLVLGTGLIFTSIVQAEPQTFNFAAGGDRNVVKYESDAPIENIVGITGKASGEISIDPSNLSGKISGQVTVDVASFNSGIEVRDEHFRDNYLHTDEYPTATFTFNEIVESDKKAIKKGEAAKVWISGIMAMHGVEKEIKIETTITYLNAIKELEGYGYKGDLLVIKSDFNIKLADFKIERPEFLLLKLADEINVDVVVTGGTESK